MRSEEGSQTRPTLRTSSFFSDDKMWIVCVIPTLEKMNKNHDACARQGMDNLFLQII